MSDSPLVSYTKISPNTWGKRTRAIDTVSIHCVVGQSSVETLGQMFAPKSRKASANYGIGYDGRIALYCPENMASQCTSNKANDMRAITIEVASDTTHPYAVTAAAYNALIDLLVDICRRNKGIPRLLWRGDKSLIGQVDKQNMTVHRWFANKACPGDYLYQRHGAIAAEVNKRLNEEDETVDINKLIADMTPEQAYRLQQKAASYAATLPEQDWSVREGHWAKATESGVVNGEAPEGYIKRCEVAAVLGRKGLL